MARDVFSEMEPFRIKMVEPIHLPSGEDRARFLEEAGLNVFLIKGENILIDLLTDSGTGAMSDRQWAGLMMGDETYAGCRNFYNLESSVRDIFGFNYVLPCHQGRGAENVLHSAFIKKGDVIPGNTHFDTTKAHIEHNNGRAVDCTVDEASDPYLDHPFKGNVDLKKLEAVYKEFGKDRIPFTVVTATCNSGGGQPVSLENMRAVKKLSAKYGIPVCLDGARYAENCYFIKTREDGMRDRPIKEIARMQADCFDMMTMSAKKDAIVNIGGFIATGDPAIYDRIKNFGILFEGFVTYGGLAGRDLEAMAIGLYEGIDEDYLGYRIGHVRYLGERLKEAGIPVLWPPGGHAIYLDMKKFLPQIPPDQFPGMAFCAHLYLESGVRGVEIGTLLNGRDPDTGKNRPATLELVRLTIPRRVYTYRHLDYVVEAVKKVWDKRRQIKGFELTNEAPVLRHFTARFRWAP
ncbi:MAG: tryptophanase [Candidatus Thermoplasmatota archaeon]|jgi:tryptophanase|nr:tryptophanase [Candidatus Thermoplasmatota archaeon]